jgi:predicted alpha/beta hydrolase family esterase
MLVAYEVFVIPGLGGSDENHWQSIWEKQNPHFKRVEQEEWDNPKLNEWLNALDDLVQQATKPIIMIGHSLGSVLIAHYAKQNPQANIKAAMLVAPADVDVKDVMDELKDFAPMPMEKLPFKSFVVASSDDPYANLVRSEEFTKNWGSELICIGNKGHINSDSGLGEWESGKEILQRFIKIPPKKSPIAPMSDIL